MMKIKEGSIFNLHVDNEESSQIEYCTNGWDSRYGYFKLQNLIARYDLDLKEVYEDFLKHIEHAEKDYFKLNRPKTTYFEEFLIKEGLVEKLTVATINLEVKEKKIKKTLFRKARTKTTYSSKVEGEIYVIDKYGMD